MNFYFIDMINIVPLSIYISLINRNLLFCGGVNYDKFRQIS